MLFFLCMQTFQVIHVKRIICWVQGLGVPSVFAVRCSFSVRFCLLAHWLCPLTVVGPTFVEAKAELQMWTTGRTLK